MKREIKFRVWHNGHMEEDVLVDSIGAWSPAEKNYNTPHVEIERYPDEAVIMQFTGLKDKNGKEIYEGDILEAKYYFAFKRWWTHIEDITEIEKGVERQKAHKEVKRDIVTFQSGGFKVFSLYIDKFLQWHAESEQQRVQYYHESGSRHSGEFYSGHEEIEVIGTIWDTPELVK